MAPHSSTLAWKIPHGCQRWLQVNYSDGQHGARVWAGFPTIRWLLSPAPGFMVLSVLVLSIHPQACYPHFLWLLSGPFALPLPCQ